MMIALCALLLLLLLANAACIFSQATESCGPKFHGKCLCGFGKYLDKENKYIVNCTKTGFHNTTVLEHLPPHTQVLIFTGNNVSELPWNVFGISSNLSQLQVVDFSSNGIRNIPGKSFHGVGSVERLILNNNELRIASDDHYHHPRVFSNFFSLQELHMTNAFADNTPENLATDLHDIFVNSNLSKLFKLHLEQNEIAAFKDPFIFCDLPSLMDLHLGDNALKGLDFNISCLPQLRFIDLERNRISALSAEELETLDTFPAHGRMLVVDLAGNPFSCDCAMKELFTWLRTTQVNVRNRELLRCHRGPPETNGGEPVLSPRQILCVAAAEPGLQHRATAIVLGVLTVVLLALAAAALYVNRQEIKHRLAPVLDSVSRKVQYTTIGRQEDQEMDV